MGKPDRRLELSSPELDSMDQADFAELVASLETSRNIGGVSLQSLNVRVIESRELKLRNAEQLRRANAPKFDKEILLQLDGMRPTDFSNFMASRVLGQRDVTLAWNKLATSSFKPNNRQIIKPRLPEKDGQKLEFLLGYNRDGRSADFIRGGIKYAPLEIIDDIYLLDPVELACSLEEAELSTVGPKTLAVFSDMLNGLIEQKKIELADTEDSEN